MTGKPTPAEKLRAQAAEQRRVYAMFGTVASYEKARVLEREAAELEAKGEVKK